MQIIKDVQKLAEFIKGIATRSLELTQDVHTAACSALSHAAEHGDSSYCSKLVHAMARGMRKNALIMWFEQYGALKWEGKGEEARFVKAKRGTFNLEAAMEHPFYEGVTSEGKEWDAKKNLAFIISKLKSGLEKATEKKNKVLAKKYQTALEVLQA